MYNTEMYNDDWTIYGKLREAGATPHQLYELGRQENLDRISHPDAAFSFRFKFS